MKVKLLKCDDVEMIDSALSQCYDQSKHGTGDKAMNRIQKVCNVYKHDSLLEFGDAIWEITASTKVLLEFTRHRMANYACKSSRYTLDKGEIIFESTGDTDVDDALNDWKELIEEKIYSGKKNDVVSLMLPQAYQYRFQVKMNFRAMKNFFHLRTSRTAHFHIREVSKKMLESLPLDIQKIVHKNKGE